MFITLHPDQFIFHLYYETPESKGREEREKDIALVNAEPDFSSMRYWGIDRDLFCFVFYHLHAIKQ